MIRKISILCFLGCIVTIFFAQFDLWVHEELKKWCHSIAVSSLYSHSTFTVESLNFFSPSLVLNNVHMTSLDGSWSWECDRCQVYASWVDLFLKGTIEKHITIDNFFCSSLINSSGHLAIEHHIVALNSPSFFPLSTETKSLVFKNAHFAVHNEKNDGTMSLFFNSSSLRIGDRLRTMMSLYDGNITYKDETYAKDIVGEISLINWEENNTEMMLLNGSGLLRLPHMADEGMCYISGSLESDHGRFSIRNAYNSFIIDPIIITQRDIKADSSIPLAYIARCMQKELRENSVTGTVTSFMRVNKKDGHIDGHLAVEDAHVMGVKICDVAKVVFARKYNDWKYRLTMALRNEECKIFGAWNELLEYGKCELYNSTPLSVSSVPHWRIATKDLLCMFIYNQCDIAGIYKVNAHNIVNKLSHVCHGGFVYDKDGLGTLGGLFDSVEFSLKSATKPLCSLQECSFLDKDKKHLALLQKDEEKNILNGHISFACIRTFINTFFNYDMQGEGTCAIQGHVNEKYTSLDVSLEDATIRLPETYNFIDGLTAHIEFDAEKKLCTAENIHISLNTGELNCLRATAFFDEKGSLQFAHVPVLLDHCLFNIKKDLFAVVSGSLLFSYNQPQRSNVSGALIIDRAQLKENLFSHVIQKQLFSYPHSIFSLSGVPTSCDLSIESKSPIRVDTAFLETNAKVNLRIQDNITDPTISGVISLQSGNLTFPYKPLTITKGTLTFLPDQHLDPVIELIARNKIKNYDVSLQLAGSLSNHHIMLDASPPLSEEQIMALLLVGSQDSVLNSMIPALIVQNLKNLLFAHNQSTFLEKYFAPLLRPFSINLIPSFSDHTGRGGLRGMLEVTVNDRLKAMIQKNFSLTEDTRVEIEFQPSDDIILRGIRDERRDLGGEIEMKWKF